MPASYILTFGGTEPNPFSFSSEAAVVSLALLGDGREPAVIQPWQMGQAWFTQKKSIYPGVPKALAYLLSTKYEYRANNTWAVTRFQPVNLEQCWAAFPHGLWNPPHIPHPRAREPEQSEHRVDDVLSFLPYVFKCLGNTRLSPWVAWVDPVVTQGRPTNLNWAGGLSTIAYYPMI